MSAEPLTGEERERRQTMAQNAERWITGGLSGLIDRYESTVQAVEAERDALARRVAELQAGMKEAKRHKPIAVQIIDRTLAADDAAKGKRVCSCARRPGPNAGDAIYHEPGCPLAADDAAKGEGTVPLVRMNRGHAVRADDAATGGAA